jgi:hypothetical protein
MISILSRRLVSSCWIFNSVSLSVYIRIACNLKTRLAPLVICLIFFTSEFSFIANDRVVTVEVGKPGVMNYSMDELHEWLQEFTFLHFSKWRCYYTSTFIEFDWQPILRNFLLRLLLYLLTYWNCWKLLNTSLMPLPLNLYWVVENVSPPPPPPFYCLYL